MTCIFCEIAAKRAPASFVHEDDEIIAIKDINPQAPIHVLVIPKLHIATVNDLEEQHSVLMGKLFMVVKRLAAQWNIVAQGYRLRVHVGRGGGQLIDHIHMHLLSGRQYRTWLHPWKRNPGPMPYCFPRQLPALSRSVGLDSAASVLDSTSTLAVRVGLGASGHACHITKKLQYDPTGTSIIWGL